MREHIITKGKIIMKIEKILNSKDTDLDVSTLSISETQHLIHQLKKRQIELENRNNKLCNLIVNLKNEPTVTIQENVIEETQTQCQKTINILIVDDDPIARETLKSFLEPDGYTLFFAEDGQQGIAQAKQLNPDLILLDILMPKLNGFEVCQRIRSDPIISDVPIIFITAISNRLDGIEAGADDYIIKPLNKAEILVRVRNIFRLNRYKKLLKERTERERLSNLIKSLEHEATIGNIASGLAHDINNILSSFYVLEYCHEKICSIEKMIPPDILEQKSEDIFFIKDCCKLLMDSVRMGLTITKGMTEFAKNGKYKGKSKQNLEPNITKPIDIFRKKFKNFNISLHIDIEKELPFVNINAPEIQRVILNLITNSVQALEQMKINNPQLNVRAWYENNSILLSIQDNGVGIPKHIQHRIYDHLFTTKEGGSGIGLSIVKRILDNHNIKINMKSEVCKGTTFVLTFPVN